MSGKPPNPPVAGSSPAAPAKGSAVTISTREADDWTRSRAPDSSPSAWQASLRLRSAKFGSRRRLSKGFQSFRRHTRGSKVKWTLSPVHESLRTLGLSGLSAPWSRLTPLDPGPGRRMARDAPKKQRMKHCKYGRCKKPRVRRSDYCAEHKQIGELMDLEIFF